MWLRLGHEFAKKANLRLIQPPRDPSSSIPTHNAEENSEEVKKKKKKKKKVQYVEDPMFSLKKRHLRSRYKDDVDIRHYHYYPNRAFTLWVVKKMNVIVDQNVADMASTPCRIANGLDQVRGFIRQTTIW